MPKLLLLLIVLLNFSCSKTEDNEPLRTDVDLIDEDKFVRKASLIDQEISFKIVTEEGEDVTDIATFYVDGEQVLGSSFSSSAIGEFEVYGVYIQDGFEVTTAIETFSVIVPKRKVVIEDYTGTWCGFCPRVTAALASVAQETDDITVVAIHETANSFPDPMHFNQVQVLKDAFGVEGFPAARINRTNNWATPHNNSDVTTIAGADTNLAIAINSELNGSELLVQVNVVYEDGSQEGDKLVAYLVENDIIYDQVNYYNQDTSSPYYSLGDPIPDFEHNEVLRENLSALLGDPIPSTPALTEYVTSFTTTIPSDYNVNNLDIIVMVVNDENEAKNSQHAHIMEDKSYE
ncbi:Omp28-related outer membrane protein [Winogradskyella sp.]|uniref:Omp28-related outer membrane protein n=1 Tax=Winogradskyella sp. TaxID=1883156 RepID=UPI0025E7438D|nr:Omp28-related outer membrane protein [Winogradskyella sp.]MCT4630707.1 Omp28-related outer membrane protein [Winogradskyella sp.]